MCRHVCFCGHHKYVNAPFVAHRSAEPKSMYLRKDRPVVSSVLHAPPGGDHGVDRLQRGRPRGGGEVLEEAVPALLHLAAPLDAGVLLDEVPLPPLLAAGLARRRPLRMRRAAGCVGGEGGELRPPAELCAGRAVARRQLGVAPEELAAGERKEEGGLSRGSEQELVQY